MLQTVHSGVAYFSPTGLLCLAMRWVMYWWRLRRSVRVRCRLMSSTAPTAAPGTASRSPRRDQLRNCPHQASMPPVQPPEFYWPRADEGSVKQSERRGVWRTYLCSQQCMGQYGRMICDQEKQEFPWRQGSAGSLLGTEGAGRRACSRSHISHAGRSLSTSASPHSNNRYAYINTRMCRLLFGLQLHLPQLHHYQSPFTSASTFSIPTDIQTHIYIYKYLDLHLSASTFAHALGFRNAERVEAHPGEADRRSPPTRRRQ